MTHFHLYPTVREFYTDMQHALRGAQNTIHMAYYAFDDGYWARRIGHTLAQRAAAGVVVHLLVDEAGLYLDNARNGLRNRRLLAHLKASGVRVSLFHPRGRRLSQFNRLHCKFCAIDDQTAFIGGSNIGDHYLGWRDCNLRLDGVLGSGFARLHKGLRQFGCRDSSGSQTWCGGDLMVEDVPLLLTTPGRRQDIRRALLELILAAETAVSLRSWYFLPDQEIMNALLTQAENGLRVTILFSHRTRIPFIDIANRPLCRRLTAAGVRIFRYEKAYMHAKAAWNDQGDILFGSANIDRWALRTNFECCLYFRHPALAEELNQELSTDLVHCQAPHTIPGDTTKRYGTEGKATTAL